MFAHFFISRPVFAVVISILIVLAGTLALTQLPIAQYPEVVPPQVVLADQVAVCRLPTGSAALVDVVTTAA